MRRLLPFLAVAVVAACDGTPVQPTAGDLAAGPPGYQAFDLGTLGGTASIAFGINNAGVIAGTSRDADGRAVAVRWTKAGAIEAVHDFGDACSGAADINDAGTIVGWYGAHCNLAAEPGAGAPFIARDGGSIELPDVPPYLPAIAVNNREDVLGWGGLFQNYLWGGDGSVHQICPGLSLHLFTVTNQRQVIGGVWDVPFGWGGLRWSPDQPVCSQEFYEDGFASFFAKDANAAGAIVGIGFAFEWGPGGTVVGIGPMTGFRHTAAGFQLLDFDPVAINARGDIVGSRNGNAVLRTHHGQLIELGPGAAHDVNNSGDVVGVGPDGTARLWTTNKSNFPAAP